MLSLAVALRSVVCIHLGIVEQELGFAALPSQSPAGKRTHSIVLYDARGGGAGFVGCVADEVLLARLFGKAAEQLDCPRQCGRACSRCLVSFDTQFRGDQLDRHYALALLRTQGFIG